MLLHACFPYGNWESGEVPAGRLLLSLRAMASAYTWTSIPVFEILPAIVVDR